MKKIDFLLFSILVFLAIPVVVLGSCAPEIQCIPGCGGEVQTRSCSLVRVGQRWECRCSPWRTHQDCQSWQRCDGGTTCYCYGPCIDIPQNPRYFNNPNFPTNPHSPEVSRDPGNILLPVKLDWDDVRGWQSEIQSYIIEIDNTTQNTFNRHILKSEFIPSPCLLRSITQHNWRVRGCCSTDGKNCGSWSDWSFKTNPAPEIRSIFGDSDNRILSYIIANDRLPQTINLFPVSNSDPDWKYPEIKREGNLMPPIVIDWCPMNEPEKGRLKIEAEHRSRIRFGEGHRFPAGFLTGYRINFYEYNEREQRWVSHFRYMGRPSIEHRIFIEFRPRNIEKRLSDYNLHRRKRLTSFFIDQNRFYLTYGTKYAFRVQRCGFLLQKGGEIHDGADIQCFDLSQKWHFKTGGNANNLGGTRILKPISVGPRPPYRIQSLPFGAKFENIPGANYYEFTVRHSPPTPNDLIRRGFIRDNHTLPLGGLFRPYNPIPAIEGGLVFTYPRGGGDIELTLNQKYFYTIRGCLTNKTDREGVGIHCRNLVNTSWFKTPGARATNLRITSGLQNGKAIIPVTFGWDHMTGVKSFRVDFYKGGIFKRSFVTRASNITIGYPDLVLNQDYNVKVWSCVDEYGRVCVDKFGGDLANRHNEYAGLDFTTFMLKIPENFAVSPLREGIKWEVKTEDFINFKWDPVIGSAYYQIEIRNPHGRVITRIVDTNSFRIHQRYLVELGDYTWKVRACIDRSCRDTKPLSAGNWSQPPASFHLLPAVAREPGAWYGLVVCGMLVDNPNTIGWNEREACAIKHIPLAAYVIIDFILWKVVPLIMVLLIILTAFFYYTAFANAEEIDQITPKVKKMWKNFAIGFFVIFFGFTIINIFLDIINFNVDIWGRWYEI